ncbi:MAG: ABC transporter ATP-binding protein/permease [Actinobacteria bacterium]|nr:ABC transporter ATP-binding protein/permease [Actinomycetota bacterium]
MSSWHALGRNDPDDGARLSGDLARRLWRFVRPHRGWLAGVLSAVTVTAVLTAIPPLVYRAIIDVALPSGRTGLLSVLALAIIGVAVGNTATQVVARWATSHLGERIIFDLRTALFEHLQRMPFAFFTASRPGALITRLTSDLAGGHRAFTSTLVSVIETVIGVVVTVGAMLLLDWRLTLLSLAIAPAFIIVVRRMRGRLHRLMQERADAEASLSSRLDERFDVGGALLVKLLGRPVREQADFAERAGRLRDVGVETAVTSRVFHGAFAFVAAVGTGLVYWVGGWLVIGEVITLGTVIAFAAYLTQLYTPLTMLANARVDLASALVSFERVFEVLDFEPPTAERPGAVALREPRGRVTFEDVSFSYPRSDEITLPSLSGGKDLADTAVADRLWALRDVSFEVPAGQTVALVGPSGAGKTTVTMLVARLYEATHGTVAIDGHDVRDLTGESLRRTVGMVTQETHLFHDTVANNLRYARPEATEDQIIEAARAARIHDLIASLPAGYETLVGERGYRFSGGEKQRLAIARLLLADPSVVVLDEATAHLDSESEREIQRALEGALEGRTSLVIAHRLSTVTSADQLLVLDGGRIAERGRHRELIDRGGLYSDLHRIQFSHPDALDGHLAPAD